MIENLIGILLSFAFVFLVLGGVTLLVRRLHLGEETSRKMIHIALCNWVFVALATFTNVYAACVVPAAFILVNYISHKKNLIKAMERSENNSLGTVWYAVSLFLLTGYAFHMRQPVPLLCGMLAMGYGDGLAALVGGKWGRSGKNGKSPLGTITMAVVTAAVVYLICREKSDFALYIALLGGGAGALLERESPAGLGNLTVPLYVGAIAGVLLQVESLRAFDQLATVVISGWILVFAYEKGAITRNAGIVALCLGDNMFRFGGWTAYSALIAFFILGSAASHIGKGQKAYAARIHKRHGPRTSWQVCANALPAFLFSLMYASNHYTPYLVAALATFSGACADTFSSEIGMLSKRPPVSLLTLKPSQPGISGGVTPLGLCGAAIGALLISLIALPLGIANWLLVLLCGIACSLLDSLMGAALQAKYRMADGSLTERPVTGDGQALELAAGLSFIGNDAVNFLSIFFTGVLAALIATLQAV